MTEESSVWAQGAQDEDPTTLLRQLPQPPHAHRPPLSLVNRQMSLAERQAFLVAYGQQSNAYFNLQEGVSYFDMPGVGFISYFSARFPIRKINIVFSRPVCAPEHMGRMLDAFGRNHRGSTIFAGMDSEMALLLQERGYEVTPLGTDFHLDIPSFSLTGNKKKYLRKAKRIGAEQITVREQRWSEVNQEEARAISERWLSTKKGRGKELRVLTRPPIFAPAWGIRRFFGYDSKGKMLGYAFFDPYFKEGQIAGYTANILRRRPEAPSVLLDYITMYAMDVFEEDGVPEMSLGMSPLHGVREHKSKSTLLRRALEMAYQYGGRFYSFKSLAFHKSRWRAEPEMLFACTKDISTLRAILFTLKICNVV